MGDLLGGGLRPAGLRMAGDPGNATDSWVASKIYRKSVAASTAYNTFDTLHAWGVAQNWQGWGVSGGATDPINVLTALPHMFPVATTIKNILIKNNVGAAATKYKIAIYGNVGSGVAYPSARLWQNAEINPLPTGITTLTVNLPVAAGSLLWMVHTCDNTGANINLSSIAASQLMGPLILGAAPAMNADPIVAWQQAQTYDGTLPATYPITAPTGVTTLTATAFMMRLG